MTGAIIEIEGTLGGYCPCTFEVIIDGDEVVVMAAVIDTPDEVMSYIVIDHNHPLWPLAANHIDMPSIEGAIQDRRDNGGF